MTASIQTEPKVFLKGLFDIGVRRVQAAECLPKYLPANPPKGRTLVLGAGKAAAAMAAAVSNHYRGDMEGLVVTRYGHGINTKIPHLDVVEAAHPVPDAVSRDAARRMLTLAKNLTIDDRLIFLASGGGSSLLSLPAEGFSFSKKQELMKHMLSSGASISEINCVRKHVSSIKGGRLASAAGMAEVLTYVISDVPGDNASDVASGPTITDHTSLKEAWAVIDKYGAPDLKLMKSLLTNPQNETIQHQPPNWRSQIIATANDCLGAAAAQARHQGLAVVNLGPSLEGDAATLGRQHAKLAIDLYAKGEPTLILSGGETTVTVKNPNGRGGRNMEYALGAALELAGRPGIFALACDTDGIDGSEESAGAYINPNILDQAASLGLDPVRHLQQNCSFDFFNLLNSLIVTGPTRTNVNDFRSILILPKNQA